MIKSLLFLTALGLVQGLKVPHPDCPAEEVHFLLPHEYDCTKFYYCEGGEKFVEPRSCPPGTEFSSEQQVCTHPILANCGLDGAPPTEGTSTAATQPPATDPPATQPPATDPPATQPPATDPPATQPPATDPPATQPPATDPPATQPPATDPPATQPPATDPPATQPPATDPPATQPPASQAPVTQPPATDPPATQPPATDPPATQPPASQAPVTQPPATQPPTTQPPTTVSSEGTTDCERFENGCPVNFEIDQYFEHEIYCRHFYRCVFGEKILQKCPRGTSFNVLIPGCDHAANVDRTCEDLDSSEEDLPINDDEESREIEFLENGCPVDSGIGWLLPHETYCNVFYQCNFGEKLWTICPPGTQFNPAEQACDHPVNVNCQLPGGNVIPTTTPAAPITQSTTRAPVDLDVNGCPLDQSISWLVPHEDCTKFYFCVHGGLVPAQCPSGLHFSPTLQRCENPAIAGCANGPCSENTDCSGEGNGNDDNVNNDDDDNVSVDDNVNNDDDDNVSNDIDDNVNNDDDDNISNDVDDNVNNDDDGNVSNDVDDNVNNDDDGNVSNDVDDNVNNDDDDNVNNDDQDNVSNDVDDNVNNDDDDNVSNDVDDNVVDDNVSEEDIINDDDGGDCDDQTQQDKKCVEECHVLPWAHEDCDKFWTCYGNKALLGICTNGLFFNPSTNTCDFACNVDCDSLKIRVTPNHDGLKMYIPWHKFDNKAKQLLKLINEN